MNDMLVITGAAHAVDATGASGADVLFLPGDNAPRAHPGERFEQLFEERVDSLAATDPGHLAIDSAEGQLTFAELDACANRLARHLKRFRLGSGDRIALLFDRSIFSYVATLAVLKINAAYVPLDVSFPADRIAFIAEDAEVSAILSLSRFRDHLKDAGVPVLHLDELREQIDAEASGRLTAGEKGATASELAYIIYTSGSTGRPKGVPIEHAMIVNFVRVAAEVYGVRADDRMYQGLTIAFDFAVEEIWVPLSVGATLVPGPPGATLAGADLGDFLRRQRVTALCCVPTLLATLEVDLPDLRYIMVSGEACPQDLVTRWQKPGRRILNAYGPTESTVTATLSELVAGKPVTIGRPLPTYGVLVLEPGADKVLPFGEAGELAIAGIGISTGYLNREEQTRKAFIADFVGIPHNASGRIYRTGDLARINAEGEVEYLGRIDTQVKIRGYRIELTEIESALMARPEIAQAVVNKYESAPGTVELAAYYTLKPGIDGFDLDGLVRGLKDRLPSYMVPAFYEQLATMPMLPSHKADRKALPPPSRPRHASGSGSFAAPEGEPEIAIAAALAALLKVPQVSVEDNFVDDLGGNSLLMAQFISRLRAIPATAHLSMRDLYLNPTIRRVAALARSAGSISRPPAASAEAVPVHKASTFAYVMTGTGQVVAMLAYLLLGTFVLIRSLVFIADAHGATDTYLRSVIAVSGGSLLFTVLPIALKWLLIGRFRAERIPVWSLAYLRFWVVKTLIRSNPMVLFIGSPLYTIYLRLLGAKIGRRVTIHSASVPIAADLISIGDDAVIHKDVMFNAYRARAGYIETGRVTIGARAFVSEATVLDIETGVGDDGQLGHVSTLHAGQSVPAGKRYQGSPAEETETDFDRAGKLPHSPVRRIAYSAYQLVVALLIAIPVPMALIDLAFPDGLDALRETATGLAPRTITLPELGIGLVAWSVAGYFGLLLLGLLTIAILPRLANLLLEPGKPYRLYGFHHAVFRTVAAASNSPGFNLLLGDSSYIVWFQSLVGWNLKGNRQTGSNFGAQQKHENPFLCAVGDGTLISDGLSMANAEMSSTAFKLVPIRIGAGNFLGNNVHFPAGGRTGDDVLLATKVAIPIDGEVRESIGLLGSPAFEIPRSVNRDKALAHLREGPDFEQRLKAKNASNLKTIGLYLLTRWFLFLATSALFLGAYLLQPRIGFAGYALATAGSVLFSAAWYILIERMTLGFGRLSPQTCSIYDPYYWFHERHWKMSNSSFRALFNGTPLKNVIWRLLGVEVGRQLFDDGASMSERSLVEIGDHVTLGDLSMIEAHSMEDGAFKSDFITIGDEVTIGANAFINYGVAMGDRTELLPDTFLMKGATVPEGEVWGGNPAREMGG